MEEEPPSRGGGVNLVSEGPEPDPGTFTGQVTAFSYDAGGRLLTVTQSGGVTNNTYTYTYDADGNRKTAVVTGSNPATQTLTFNVTP